jgi:hypothetical protein
LTDGKSESIASDQRSDRVQLPGLSLWRDDDAGHKPADIHWNGQTRLRRVTGPIEKEPDLMFVFKALSLEKATLQEVRFRNRLGIVIEVRDSSPVVRFTPNAYARREASKRRPKG